MHVTSVSVFSYKPSQLSKSQSFGSCECHYYDENCPTKKIRTNTYALRRDIEWDELALMMNFIFKNKQKVNVYSLACSDGSEPYSMAIALMEELKKMKVNPTKFFPITASDKNKNLIAENEKGLWNLRKSDIERFNGYGYNPHKYLTICDKKHQLENDALDEKTETYKIKEPLRAKVQFSHCTLEDRLKDIDDDSNTVILCRNVLPYFFDEGKVIEIAKLASEKLKDGSLFVVGEYDYRTGIADYLQNVGFVDLTGDGEIFQKKKEIKFKSLYCGENNFIYR